MRVSLFLATALLVFPAYAQQSSELERTEAQSKLEQAFERLSPDQHHMTAPVMAVVAEVTCDGFHVDGLKVAAYIDAADAGAELSHQMTATRVFAETAEHILGPWLAYAELHAEEFCEHARRLHETGDHLWIDKILVEEKAGES